MCSQCKAEFGSRERKKERERRKVSLLGVVPLFGDCMDIPTVHSSRFCAIYVFLSI